MADKKQTLVAISLVSLIGGLGYWIYLYVSDPDSAPRWSDVLDWLQSIPVRGYLIVKGKIQDVLSAAGANPDPLALAAGIIAAQEGFVGHVYADPPGQTIKHSIGYGHELVEGDGYDLESTVSQAEGLALLQSDLQRYADAVNAEIEVALSPQQLAALYDFTYNEGIGAFRSSTLLKQINAGNFDAAASEFLRWDIVSGQANANLEARRQMEADLFTSYPAPAQPSNSEEQPA